MTLYVKKLTCEERAVFGKCPVCEALPGEPCCILASDPPRDEVGTGAHVARLVNAPTVAAVESGG
jgi:hypothetical protein